MRDLQRDHCLRLTRIETEVVGLRRDQVSDAETVVHFETRLDRPRDDVERIKRRLDIQDA
ncbi:MAG: hypothetical protein HZC25_09655 [Rhodospirillales bacterium]|nr:hypothetical protein [Rhodospirillales bacterium]